MVARGSICRHCFRYVNSTLPLVKGQNQVDWEHHPLLFIHVLAPSVTIIYKTKKPTQAHSVLLSSFFHCLLGFSFSQISPPLIVVIGEMRLLVLFKSHGLKSKRVKFICFTRRISIKVLGYTKLNKKSISSLNILFFHYSP